jgi:hypothetical protein
MTLRALGMPESRLMETEAVQSGPFFGLSLESLLWALAVLLGPRDG